MFDDNGSFLLTVFEIFLFCAALLCLFWAFGDVFRSRDLGGWGKAAWVIFLIVLPLLGMLVYLIARGSGWHERETAPELLDTATIGGMDSARLRGDSLTFGPTSRFA
jgi:Phospholipase_D-nuclease N-terminal